MRKRTFLALLTVLLLHSTLPLMAAGTEADLRAALKTYREALVKKDYATLEKIWTADYLFVDAQGRVRSKADRLADLRSSATALSSIKEEVPAFRIHGDVGIITSTVTITGRYGGKVTAGDFRSTHIWIFTQGRWQLLMNQLTAVQK